MMLATAVSSGGPSFAVHGWEASIIIFAAVLAALVGIWKIVVPFVRACLKVGQVVDTLANIATEFRPNGGHSLHDTILRIEEHTAEAVAQGKEAAERSREAVAHGAVTHEKLEKLYDYAHGFRHDALSEIAKLKMADAALEVLVRQSTALQTTDSHKLDAIKDEVHTANAQTLAQLADSEETRRIATIPAEDRTRQEQDHIRTIPTPTPDPPKENP